MNVTDGLVKSEDIFPLIFLCEKDEREIKKNRIESFFIILDFYLKINLLYNLNE